MEGTFEEFLDALLAYESGWDRERYDAGIIQDWQLDQWSGGTVQDFYPQYSSWSELTGDEWETMAYRSLNVFGFVGYQFGEALLIDLGYYDADVYYGNGADTNAWLGAWTGKNGADSLEDFMTKEVQDLAIRDAFGHNLEIITDGLADAGRTLDEFIGTTINWNTGSGTVPVTVTMTGILASAHLRGAPAVVSLFLDGSLSNDEFGTSILQYMDQFGGFDAPGVETLVAAWEDGKTGDEGLGLPGESQNGSSGSADVDPSSADVVIVWNWGQAEVVTGFDPANDTIYIDWFKAEEIDVAEIGGSVVFSIPTNNQSVTLQGITLSDLSASNFTIMDATAAQEILAQVGTGSTEDSSEDAGNEPDGQAGEDTSDDAGADTGNGNGTDDNAGDDMDENTDNTAVDDTTDGANDNASGDTGEDAAAAPRIIAYFPEWGIYERDHYLNDVQVGNITNLIYSFINLNEDFELELHDPWAATQIGFRAEESVDGVADRAGDGLLGHFNQLEKLKEANPHLTTQLGIGGWTLSDNFSDMAATAQGRATFINSVIEFLEEYTMFDGIDFDWEYPGGGGLAGNSARPEDGANFSLLAAEMREALDQLGSETGREYTMSAALPGGHDKIANLDIPGLAESLDYMGIMTYDFYGAWQNTTGHLAGMYDLTGNNYDVTSAIEAYLAAGVDPSQIVMGLPSYSRAWQGVSVDSPIDAWNSPSAGGAPGTYPDKEPAYYEYRDLLEELQAQDSNWGLYYDDDAQAAFLYNPTTGIFSSFETPSTIALKSEWAQSLGLGGVMFWDTSGDSNGSESLIGAAYNSWFEGMTFDEIDAASALEFDEVFGGDGIVAPIAEADTPPSDLPDGPSTGDESGDDSDNGDADSGSGDGDGGTGSGAGGDPVNPSAVQVTLDSVWAGAVSATLSITAQEDMEDWTLSFEYAGDIQDIRGATIVSHEGNVYTVRPSDENVAVSAGETVSFGFYGVGASAEITPITLGAEDDSDDTPDDTEDDAGDDTSSGGDTDNDTGDNSGDDASSDDADDDQVNPSSVQVTLDSVWAGAVAATLSITAQEDMTGWTLSFEYDGDIQNISDATIVSQEGNVYTVQSTDENADIAAGETVSFSFYGVGASTEITPITVGAEDGSDDTSDNTEDNSGDTGDTGDSDTGTGDDTGNDAGTSKPVLTLSGTSATEGNPAKSNGNPPTGQMIVDGPLSTSGSQIIDANGDAVQIKAVAWFGAENDVRAPHGLWTRTMEDMMDQMVEQGFNAIRLPFSVQNILENQVATSVAGDPSLAGLTTLEIFDRIVDYADEIGIKIILDAHRSTQGNGAEGIWYNAQFSEDDWIDAWELLAERYGESNAVIGADLFNEPHSGSWGDGAENDWAAAATKAGNAVLDIAPDWLIVVEGIASYEGEDYWWGGQLQGVRDHPIELNVDNQLVYSPHDYPASVFPQPWFSDGSDLYDVFRENWGFIVEEDIAPILLGEFGSRLETQDDLIWAEAITTYLSGDFDGDGTNDLAAGETGVSFSWWSWNPNSSDTGGILENDWRTIRENAAELLAPFLNSQDGSGGSEAGATYLTFDIMLDMPATEDVTYTYETRDGTAVAGQDYEATTGVLTVAAGQTTAQIQVRVLPDSDVEADETFALVLTDSDGVETIATGTIANDDSAADGGSGPDDGEDDNDSSDGGNADNGDDADTGDGSGTDTGGNSDDDTDGDTGSGTANYGNGTANVTAATATVAIDWNWGSNTVVTDFNPAMDTIFLGWFKSDVIDISEADGNTVFSIPSNNQSVTLQGVTLDELSPANFTILDDETATEILSAISQGDGGTVVVPDDTDGSSPPQSTGTTDQGGVNYMANWAADDITGFDVTRDAIDFRDISVHNMIVTKLPTGELAIDNPWTDELQIVQGVDFTEFSIENFGVVGNEHFRQDIGGVLSWELGIGPREDDTVYLRSHEYGVQEVIDGFDPVTMKISFLYFGTRERLSVEDTSEGLVISSLPSGQSFTFTGVTLSDLQPNTLEFHHDQVMEDNLEAPFGFSQNDVTLVSRADLLTPEAPAGQITDGHQVREGTFDAVTPVDHDADSGDHSGHDMSMAETDGMGDSGTTGDTESPAPFNGGGETVTIDWNWAAQEVISGFDATEDQIDFSVMRADSIDISEVEDDLYIEILGNGGQTYVFENTQAEDLSQANLTAPDWNDEVLEEAALQLSILGNDEFA